MINSIKTLEYRNNERKEEKTEIELQEIYNKEIIPQIIYFEFFEIAFNSLNVMYLIITLIVIVIIVFALSSKTNYMYEADAIGIWLVASIVIIMSNITYSLLPKRDMKKLKKKNHIKNLIDFEQLQKYNTDNSSIKAYIEKTLKKLDWKYKIINDNEYQIKINKSLFSSGEKVKINVLNDGSVIAHSCPNNKYKINRDKDEYNVIKFFKVLDETMNVKNEIDRKNQTLYII